MSRFHLINKILTNKVVNATGWYTFSEFFVKGLAFLTLPIFTRLLTIDEFGIVSVYGSVVSISTVILGFSLPISIARAKIDFKTDFSGFVFNILILNYVLFLFLFLPIYIFRVSISRFSGLEVSLIVIMLFHGFALSILKLYSTKLKYEYKYRIVSLLNVIVAISSVFFSLILMQTIYIENRSFGKIIGQAGIVILVGVIITFIMFKSKKSVNLKYWKYAATLSFPFIFHELSGIINSLFDRIMINTYLGSFDAGIYSFSYNIGLIVSVLLVASSQAINPWFFEKMSEEKTYDVIYYSKIYRDMFTLFYIILLFISPEIVKVIAPEQYWEGIILIPWIFLAYYFQFLATFETRVEHFHKNTKLISLGTALTAILNIALNSIFIPIYGYTAAAVTTVISFIALFLIHAFITSKILRVKVYNYHFYLYSVLIVMLATVLHNSLINQVIIRYIITICVTLAYFLYMLTKAKKLKLF